MIKKLLLLVFVISGLMQAASFSVSVPTLDQVRAQMAAVTPEQRAAYLATLETLPLEQREAARAALEKQKFFQGMMMLQEQSMVMMYSIVDKETDQLVGQIDIRGIVPGYKMHELEGQYGIWINDAFWGKGLAQEAMKLLVKSYFEITKADRLNGFLLPSNERSQRAHQKAGFRHVATANASKKLIYEITPDAVA